MLHHVPAHGGAQDLDILPGPGEGLPVGLAVPPLDDLRSAGPDAEREPSVGEVVHGHRGHGGGGGGARRHLHDGGAEREARGAGAEPRERRQRVGPVGLGRPDGVEPALLGGRDGLLDPLGLARAPVAQSQTQLHRLLLTVGLPASMPGVPGRDQDEAV